MGPRGYKGEQGKSIEVRGATGDEGVPGPKERKAIPEKEALREIQVLVDHKVY